MAAVDFVLHAHAGKQACKGCWCNASNNGFHSETLIVIFTQWNYIGLHCTKYKSIHILAILSNNFLLCINKLNREIRIKFEMRFAYNLVFCTKVKHNINVDSILPQKRSQLYRDLFETRQGNSCFCHCYMSSIGVCGVINLWTKQPLMVITWILRLLEHKT